MDKKTIIIFALAGIALIFLFMVLGSNRQIAALKKEREKLKGENIGMGVRLQTTLQQNKQFEEKLASLNKDLENINAEKGNIQQRYDLLLQEREKLISELKKLKNPLARTGISSSAVLEPSSQTQADVYWAGVLKEKTALELELSNLQEEFKTLKMSNEQLQQGKRDNELEIDLLNRDNQDFKREFEYSKKLLDSLSQELSREKTDKYQIQEDLKTVKAENKFLRQQLKTTEDRKILLEGKLADLQSKNTELENSLSKMETFIKEKIIQMDSLKEELGLSEKPSVETRGKAQAAGAEKGKESVELQPIIVRPQETKSKTEISALKGNVLAVNKENNFVIINLGQNTGIRTGDTFRVYNARDEIAGSIVVVEVRKEIAACDINQENFPIKVGDTVRQIPDF